MFLFITFVVIGLIILGVRNGAKQAKIEAATIPPHFEKILMRHFIVSLESMQILTTSAKIETVRSRLGILHDALLKLAPFTGKRNYHHYMAMAVEKMTIDYYDKNVPQEHLIVVRKPLETLSIWDDFAQSVLCDTFRRFALAHQEHILQLKTPKGKIGRINKVIDELDLLIDSFTNQELKDDLFKMQVEFIKIRDNFQNAS